MDEGSTLQALGRRQAAPPFRFGQVLQALGGGEAEEGAASLCLSPRSALLAFALDSLHTPRYTLYRPTTRSSARLQLQVSL